MGPEGKYNLSQIWSGSTRDPDEFTAQSITVTALDRYDSLRSLEPDQQTPLPRSPSIPEAEQRSGLPHRARAQLPSPPGVGWRGCFPFIFLTSYFAFLFVSPSSLLTLPVLFSFFLSVLCQIHLSGPRGPASRILSCAQTRIWETLHCLPQDQAFGQLGGLVFNQQNPWQGKTWSRGACLNF